MIRLRSLIGRKRFFLAVTNLLVSPVCWGFVLPHPFRREERTMLLLISSVLVVCTCTHTCSLEITRYPHMDHTLLL